MQDKIEILEVSLLEDRNKLKVIDHWLSVMNWPNGWHYDLDIIWVLQHIERLKLPRGATIIDAGAGLGMTQFILSSLGYNVISLDFTMRKIPRFAERIFVIENVERDLAGYTHEYMDFMKYDQNKAAKGDRRSDVWQLLKKACDLQRFDLNLYKAKGRLKEAFNLSYLFETMKNHDGFGKIVFLRGTFNNIPLPDQAVDALISVSAFEHNTYEDMPASIGEFMRVVKKGAPLLITTSASRKEDWYFRPSKGWNFSKATLSRWFEISDDRIIFDYDSVFEKVTENETLKRRLSPFYKFYGDNGLPYGDLKKAEYLPVGILKVRP